MRKQILLTLMGLSLAVFTQAEPITQEQAKQLAEKFLQKKAGSRRLAPITNRAKLAPARLRVSTTSEPTYYVFNRGEKQGFIIVSGDTRAPEVLGYCDEGEFDYSKMPVNMREWMNCCDEQINAMRVRNMEAPARRVATHPAIAPLVTCQWNQGSPYNMYCPNYFGEGTSVTGCVATAMAQIMYYQRAKSTDRTLAEMPDYYGETAHETYGKLHVEGIPEGSPIDWNNMRDKYSGGESLVQRQAVANLMHYCGVAVHMDYTPSSSGAYYSYVPEALKNYFGYGESVHFEYMSSYSNDQWDELIYSELAAARPFFMGGHAANASMGHAFICDGYDGNHLYHINWGWGGQSDGYYYITNLTPGSQGIGGSEGGFNSDVFAIIGVEPENFLDMAIRFTDSKVKALCVANWDADGNGELSFGEAAQITDLGTVFQGASAIKSFNELRNFTSLPAISDDAFNGCRALTTLVMPNSVKAIGARAFSGCRALKSLVLPAGITSIGEEAFNGCRAVGNFTLPAGITQIGTGTFEGCAAITEMELPEGITALGDRAFASCTKLQTLRVHAANPADIQMGADVFNGMKLATALLIVDEGGKQLFSEADQWKEFGSIKERRTQPDESAADYEQQLALYNAAQALENLLNIAAKKNVNADREQAVFDSMESTLEDLFKAQRTLRKKLNFINFADDAVRAVCVANYDLDADGEISSTEGAMVSDIYSVFTRNTNIQTFDELQYFTNLTMIYGNSFDGCTNLKSLKLPENVTNIYYRAFYGCSGLTEISLPDYVTYLGFNCFTGCTSLRTVHMANPDPSSIYTDESTFEGLDLSAMTLYVPYGSKEEYASTPIWKDFGEIKEFRAKVYPSHYSPLVVDEPLYLCNIAEKRYMTKGEAWGTQAIVGKKGMKYQLKRSANMPEGQYYLYSTETGKDGKVLFRTNTDSNVGSGVTACFVDGSLSEKAYWVVAPAQDTKEENIYTFRVPGANDSIQYLGVNPVHESNTYPTYGAYWDFNYWDNPSQCHWAFVTVADVQAIDALNELAKTLKHYLDLAQKQQIDCTDELAVYDNVQSTADELQAAIDSVKAKLHYIIFADSRVKTICVNNWDLNEDDELSYEEAAAVTDLGEIFRGISTIKSFEELRYFTGLTSISENAFRNCSSLYSIYIPENVTQIGKNALSSTSQLKYVAIMHPEEPLHDSSSSGLLRSTVNLFVLPTQIEAYQSDEYWSRFSMQPYTGAPVITVQNDTATYGRALSRYNFKLTGAPVNTAPVLVCPANASTPVGQYPITVQPGVITSPGLICHDATLTILPAPLTITARSYTRSYGEPNPEFGVTYKGFKNNDKAESLVQQPICECDAQPDSPAGEYEIRVYGAESPNYDITYVFGTLTVDVSTGIAALQGTHPDASAVYDLQGRKVSDSSAWAALPKGIYIVGGKKVVKK
ncbi:MAG: leucine-rich repeat protein [Bacteroidaceae bacterium]|nr:leucine-rich repeat protein [Bacteroidaceae bacterium]